MRDNLARKLNYNEPQRVRKTKALKKKKPKTGIVIMALLCFGIGLLTIQRFAMIYSLDKQYQELQAELRILKASNEQRKIELEQSIDLNTLDKIAKTDLNMHKPTEKQIVKINVKNTDSIKILNEAPNNKFFYAMLMQSTKTVPSYLDK